LTYNNTNGEKDMSGVIKFTEDMKDMGSLSSLNILKNDIGEKQAQALIKIKHEKKMITLCGLKGDETELNLSGNMNGAADALMLAEEIKDMGSLSCVNLLKNDIPVQQAQELVKIKESKPILKSLCGFTLDETELDFSSQRLRAGDAVLLASDIQDMGALVYLSLASNNLDAKCAGMLAPAIQDMGSLSKLDLSKNNLLSQGAKHVAEVLPKW
jgi:Ran GTPase-activating protein (RanGAP) involved in mRNA processing and transport